MAASSPKPSLSPSLPVNVDKPRSFQRALITGIADSGGSYLAEHIVETHPEVEVHGLVRWHSTTVTDNFAAVHDKITLYEADLNDLGSVVAAVEKARPDGTPLKRLDSSRLLELGWHPTVSFEEGLQATYKTLAGLGIIA